VVGSRRNDRPNVLFGCDMAMNQTCYALASTTETPFALVLPLRAEIDALVHAAHGSVFRYHHDEYLHVVANSPTAKLC